jgi:autotransporter-associated beta strand protein
VRPPRTQGKRRRTISPSVTKNNRPFATASAVVLVLVAMAAPTLAVDAVWEMNPSSSFWNDDFNWTPAMAPIHAGDTATFNFSTTTSLFFFSEVTIDSMTFNAGASAFTIDTSGSSLSFAGVGIVNNSGVTQTIKNEAGSSTNFLNSSTAGNASITSYNGGAINFFDSSTAGHAGLGARGGVDIFATLGGSISFFNNSSADNATLDAGGGAGAPGGSISFFDNSTAGNATMTAEGGLPAGAPGGGGGTISFSGNSTAGNATLSAIAGLIGSGSISFSDNSNAGDATLSAEGSAGGSTGFAPAVISFSDTSSAGNATITSEDGSYFSGGVTRFSENSSAANATVVAEGGGQFGLGGIISFLGDSTADGSTLVANGGLVSDLGSGGSIFFGEQSTGGTARIEVFLNGNLDISSHLAPSVTVGSIEGDGAVFVGANNLSVGSNNLNTLFSGAIQDGGESGGSGGSLTKIGTGTLTLSGTNTYSGATTVNGGSLIVDGSISSIQTLVNAGGLLGGNGYLGGNLVNHGIVTLAIRPVRSRSPATTRKPRAASCGLKSPDSDLERTICLRSTAQRTCLALYRLSD